MFGLFTKKQDSKKVKELGSEISLLNKKIEGLNATVKQLYDTVTVLTAAQFQLGNDLGVIYSTLKSLANPSSLEDDLFSLKKDDDDKGYLN